MGNPRKNTESYKKKLAANKVRKAGKREAAFEKKTAVKALVTKAVRVERAKWTEKNKQKTDEVETMRARSNEHMRLSNIHRRSSNIYKLRTSDLDKKRTDLERRLREEKK